MKILFRNVHLYLSLAAGLVIAVLCFTGAVLVFEHELEEAFHPERYHVANTGSRRLPLQKLVGAVQAAKPQGTITGVKVYADPTRTMEVSLAGDRPAGGPGGEHRERGRAEQRGGSQAATPAGKPQAAKGGKGGGGRGGPTLFVNPYTAQVISEYSYRDSFFFTMFALHRGMVAGAVGKLIVGVSTLFFLFIIGTGLVLWWPASNKVIKQRLTVKWDASWKRLNHDLHLVLGFYASLFLFVFAFTGLAWSFEWFNKGIFTLTNSEMQGPEPPQSAAGGGARLSFDAAYAVARQQVPGAYSYAISLPQEPTEAARINTTGPAAAYEGATDELYLDQYTGQPLGKLAFQDRNLGQRVRRTFKPVHTGAIFGLPSKIIALVVCLLGVTFPITGVIMWLNRLKKEKKRARPVATIA